MERRWLLFQSIFSLGYLSSVSALFTIGTGTGIRQKQYIDLSYPINNDTLYFPGHTKYEKLIDTEYDTGGRFATHSMTMSEHTSTHIDAPFHVYKNGRKVHEIPNADLISVDALMVNVSHKITTRNSINYNYGVSKLDFLEWEHENGIIPERSVVLINTGWAERWPNEDDYIGMDRFGTMHYPGLDQTGAKFLATERNIVGVGIDTISIDPGYSKHLLAHSFLASRNIYMLENLANLHLLPVRGFEVWIMPMKLEDGTGAPARLVASIPT